VLLTMGTVFGSAAVFAAALAGLAALDVNVLVTVGPQGDAGAFAADPGRVRAERFVPLDLALDRCALVVAHGGAGTTLAALARGLPLVLIPQGADQFLNAERAVAAGAAVAITPAEFGSDALRSAVARVLRERSYAAAAARVRDEVAAMPGPAQAADALVARVYTRRAGGGAHGCGAGGVSPRANGTPTLPPPPGLRAGPGPAG
jgi:MGT family glycosyltransferase